MKLDMNIRIAEQQTGFLVTHISSEDVQTVHARTNRAEAMEYARGLLDLSAQRQPDSPPSPAEHDEAQEQGLSVGDTVECERYGIGKVINNDVGEYYPIQVEFAGNDRPHATKLWYSPDGKIAGLAALDLNLRTVDGVPQTVDDFLDPDAPLEDKELLCNTDADWSVGQGAFTVRHGHGIVMSVSETRPVVDDNAIRVRFENGVARGFRRDGYYTINDGITGDYDLQHCDHIKHDLVKNLEKYMAKDKKERAR